MSISNYAVLIFLLEIITETYGTSSCNNDNNWQVATFCETTQATGSIVVLDGYGFYQDSSSEKKCHCIAVVSIPNNGSSSLVFSKLFSLQPNYDQCGSYISVSDSDEKVIHRCFVAGTMTVNNQEKVDIELVKESDPEDTRYCMTLSIADAAASLTVTCNPDVNTTTTSTTIAQSSVSSSTTPQFTTSSLREDTTSMSTTTKGTATEMTSGQSTRPSSTSTSSTSINSTGLTDIFDDVIDTTSTTAVSSFSTPFITDTTTSQKPSSTSDITISIRTSSSVGLKTESTLLATDTPTTMTPTSADALSTSTLSSTKQTKTTQQETDSPSTKMTSTSLQKTSPKSSTEAPATLTETTTSPPSSSSPNISSSIMTTTVRTSVESTSKHGTTTVQHSSDKSSQMPIDSSTKQSSTAPVKKEEDDLPIEIIIPVAIVGGLLIIILTICVAIGIRRKGCRCNDDHTASSNNLVDKVSVDIKNREKDTYVNPLYDDISLTGKSDRSDRDSMMQEHPSDDGEDIFDSYNLPASTEIDGELWTHL